MMLLVVFYNINQKQVIAQDIYKMSNAKVYACKGTLTDSEANQQSTGKYANNESLIFTIVVKGASSIDIKFKGSFCTENIADYLKVYRGNDTNGTLFRTYTGSINNPSPFNISDSALTFYFRSDQNIVCDGWELTWEGKITQVPQPIFNAIADPNCNSNRIRVTLDQKFHCDSIKSSNFTLSGALSTSISSVVPINCVNKETNTFDVNFASGLNRSGNYLLDFNSYFKDACDSIWLINAKLNFKITNCPIVLNLVSNRYIICKGSCANLTAVITGGNSANYSYTWLSGGLSGAPPKSVCPTSDTRYILRVSDGVSLPGIDTVDISVLDPPIAQNDTTICQSSGPFNLKGLPTGGNWTGTGITNGANGTFNPATSGGGVFKVFYNVGTCRDSVIVTVRAINAGAPNAACPNASPFFVTGFSPTGGTWSGTHIASNGLFTPPSSPGSFVVTYSWNGCLSNKTINIDGIQIIKADTICKSKPLDTIKGFSPIGGSWSGPGLTNARLGISNPNTAGAGNKNYIYVINGCRDTLKRVINDVDARWDEIACPDAGQRVLPSGLPAGGFWTGKGIVDPVNGIFDADSFRVPNKITFAQTNLTYSAPNGCKDVKIMFLRYTRFLKDTIRNCFYDTTYFMRNAYLQNDPWNMLFTGSGAIVGNVVYNQKFSPNLAGKGTFHQIVGDANGCMDTMVIQVYPRPKIQKDTSFCIADDPFKLFNGEGKGVFSGSGITSGINGIFNPAIAGIGNHIILYSYPGRCIDTIKISVTALPSVSWLGLRDFYCYKDSNTIIQLNPNNGVLSGASIFGNIFNPTIAGSGFHQVTYKVGTGKCINQLTKDIEVGIPIQLTLNTNKDSVCIGETVELATISSGGYNNVNLLWSSGQQNVANIYEVPKSSQIYSVEAFDGCSDPVSKSQFIYVHPQMYGQIQTNDKLCFGNMGFANLQMNGVGPYSYLWNTVPQQTTNRIEAPVSNTYNVRVQNLQTGCFYDTSANVLGYPRIRAFFTTAPSGQCVYSDNALVKIINLSEGGKTGNWYFGDGQSENYDENINPSHLYIGDTDFYQIQLVISNEGGCVDSFKVDVCVLDSVAIYMPEIFSPNNDGINDVFKISSNTVRKMTMEIYNRWGEKVFYSDDPKVGWDGKYKGSLCSTDYFVYHIKYKGKSSAWKFKKGVLYLLR
jgi:gliding motility-associated-like protein